MDFQLFVIWSNCYFAVFAVLRLLVFFTSFTEFLCIFIDFSTPVVLRVSSSVHYAGNSVGWACMVFSMFWDLLFFPSFIGFCWFLNMLTMCWDLLGQSWRLFRYIFSFSSFLITAISLFRQYLDSLCFFMHLLGFLCVLVISMIHFVVWGFRCLFSVRNSIGSTRRLFRCVLRFAVFLSLDWISVLSVKCSWCQNFSYTISRVFIVSFQVFVILSCWVLCILSVPWSL